MVAVGHFPKVFLHLTCLGVDNGQASGQLICRKNSGYSADQCFVLSKMSNFVEGGAVPICEQIAADDFWALGLEIDTLVQNNYFEGPH